MVKEYLKTALREIARHRGYSFIKILGLSIGIAACILIYLFVADELSFDNFHRNGDKLFRVLQVQFDKTSGAETGFQQFIPTPVGPGLIRSVPEVLRQSRFVTGQGVFRPRGPARKNGDDHFRALLPGLPRDGGGPRRSPQLDPPV
jgi:hypothetical protein